MPHFKVPTLVSHENEAYDSRCDTWTICICCLWTLVDHDHDQAELEAPAQGPQSGADDVQNEADSQDSSSGEAFVVPHPISEEELSAALAAVDTLQVGGWIAQETSEGEQRCKLAVKIRASEKMVFVNRLGIKVLDIQRQELARLLVHGAVTILDTGAAFDSTLERVVRTIQKEKK